MAKVGVSLMSDVSVRDLGIAYTAGVARDTSINKARASKAAKRSIKVHSVSRKTRSARKLFRSGVFAQKTWGHQSTGMELSVIQETRVQAGKCSGINNACRCLTIAIFLSYGRRGDPWQIIVKQTLELYFQLLRYYTSDSVREDLRYAWSDIKSRVLHKGKILWKLCHGIVGVVICTLAQAN